LNKLNFENIYNNLPKNRVKVDIFEEIDSTNDEAKRISLENEFHLVIAEKQSKGRGRHGKTWLSPDSQNIYMTICTQNELSFAPESLITGIICKKSINNINKSINIGLKWPNDLILNKKKIGGILIEKEHYQNTIKTIIGIGINLNIEKKESWWGDLSEFNLENKRSDLISEITNNLIKVFDEKDFDWLEEWQQACVHMNKEIKIRNNKDEKQNAIFKGVDNFGNAIIETASGLGVFSSGQITIKGIY
tara:strand:+ start:35 stop:778 length:744 start_codon:yes stop_codon:yes gene_type:complete